MSETKPELIIKDKRHWVDDENAERKLDGDEPDLERMPTFVKQLQLQADEHDKKLKEYISAYKAKMAENDQFRARLEKDVERRVEQGIGNLIRQIVPVLDNFDLAIGSADKAQSIDKLVEGMVLIRKSINEILSKAGITEVECLGKEFNPAIAEAVSGVPVEDKSKDNIVIEVLQPGYVLNELLIRPARVKVGKYQEK